MKTSNKLLLSALILFVISLGIYNTVLKAEYLTGNYKDPFKNYAKQNFKDFDEIEVNAASRVNVNIAKGESDVRVSKKTMNQIKVTQQGRKLIINLAYGKDDKEGYNMVLIKCPKLTSVTTHAFYTDKGKVITDNYIDENKNYSELQISDFKQDSLSLLQDNASIVKLINNQLGMLKVVAGITLNANPALNIGKDNKIDKANLEIGQKTDLEINNVFINQLKYHFSDSTKVTLTGIALKSLKQ